MFPVLFSVEFIRIALGYKHFCRSQWSRDLKGGAAVDRLLGLLVRIPPGASMSVGLCDGPIPRPEDAYRRVVCHRG